MKILFLYPNSGSQVGFNYGVAHMAGVLRKAGHEVAFWQLCEELEPLPSREAFVQRIGEEGPDLLAFSVVTNQWTYARELASWAREALPIPRVIGGVHVLFSAEEVVSEKLFDYAFRGESEEAFLEFVERWSQGQSVEDVRNLVFMKEGRIQINPVRPLPVLDELPPKDYSIMDFQRLIDAKNGWVGLMASRGCPFSCTYCFNHQMVALYRKDLRCKTSDLHYMRRFSVQKVIQEIQDLLRLYQRISTFIFDDDLFTFDKAYVKEFCKAYAQTTSIPFVVNAHVNLFDEEMSRDLAGAGCKVVKFGLESGSSDVRRRILNRHMTNQRIKDAIRQVGEAGMHSSVFVIIGFPHETIAQVRETIQLLAEAKPGRFRWTYFFPYPGTEAHRLSQEGGYIDQAKMDSMVNFTDESCLDFGPDQNLFLSKVGRVMPWFVNAASSLPVAPLYRERVDEILSLDESGWKRLAPSLHEEDKRLSRGFAQQGLSHYAIKYNPFMGVISDYFLNE